MEKESKLLKLLELVSQRIADHRDALWEEEKHYTWWIYIIFGGLIYIFVNDYLCLQWKMVLITLGSLFGVFISLTGYNVIRRESEQFHLARQIYARTVIALGLNQPIPRPNGCNHLLLMPEDEIKEEDFESVSCANKPRDVLRSALVEILPDTWNLKKKLKDKLTDACKTYEKFGIRDAFQLTFLISASFFTIVSFISVLTLLRMHFC